MANLKLQTAKGVLELPLQKAILNLYLIATYPILIVVAYALVDIKFAVFVVIFLILTNRGKL